MPRTRELRIQLWSKCHYLPGTAIQIIKGMKVKHMWSWKSARGFRQINRHCITMQRVLWYDKILLECFAWTWGGGSCQEKVQFSSVAQCVRLFVTPWTAACQASLSITNSWIYPNSCPLSQWCHPIILSSVVPFSSCLQSFPASGSFQRSQLFASGGQSIGSQLQHQSFQWTPRTDLL